jgi:hypothetical protein
VRAIFRRHFGLNDCDIVAYSTGGTLLVAQFVEALRYKPEGLGFLLPKVSLEFFIDIILPAALWPLGRYRL